MDSYAQPWKRFAKKWATHYAPPWRASPQDCRAYRAFIQKAIQKKKRPNALVLGATPELRNILHSLKIPVTIIDINLEMILAMNEFVPRWEEETIVKGSWITNPLADRSFDVIVGDLTWPNVPRPLWRAFTASIHRLLKPGGAYIQRINIIPDSWKREEVSAIVDIYARLPYSLQRHAELFIHLMNNGFDMKARTVSVPSVYEQLLPYVQKGPIIRLTKRIKEFWGDTDKQWSTDRPAVFKRHLAPYFSFVSQHHSTDYRCANVTPIWWYKKR